MPATESGGRIHTSAATVAVLPEAEEVDVQIDDKDLRIDVYRSSGPGGQSVNTTDSAVRITHLPTGLVVIQQDEKSQHKNKAKAMKVLRARLYEQERERIDDAERAGARKSMVGSGDRSERIRTYNFPQGRVTDHRINLTLHRLPEILEGEMDELIGALIAEDEAERLARLDDAIKPLPSREGVGAGDPQAIDPLRAHPPPSPGRQAPGLTERAGRAHPELLKGSGAHSTPPSAAPAPYRQRHAAARCRTADGACAGHVARGDAARAARRRRARRLRGAGRRGGCAHEPIAYITGTARLLDDRPGGRPGRAGPAARQRDADRGGGRAFRGPRGPATILDLGTGPGALLLAALAAMAGARGLGIDRSRSARSLCARRNAERLGMADRARIRGSGDWAEAIDGRFDLILCNPPYIESDGRSAARCRRFRAGAALFAGADGLDDYRRLAPMIADLLVSHRHRLHRNRTGSGRCRDRAARR